MGGPSLDRVAAAQDGEDAGFELALSMQVELPDAPLGRESMSEALEEIGGVRQSESAGTRIAGATQRRVERTMMIPRRRVCPCATGVFVMFGSLLSADPGAAQALEQRALAGGGGIADRSSGDVAACCGPFRSTLEQSRALWASGALFRRVSSRMGIDGEVSWNREPGYVAYFQGEVGGNPVRGYRTENRVSAITVAGLVRVRSWYSQGAAFDIVAGLGWARETRRSELKSVVFRPGFLPEPTIVAATDTARNAIPLVLGADLAASARHVGLVALIRLHLLAGANDKVRTDLELGRRVVRVGLGVRTRF